MVVWSPEAWILHLKKVISSFKLIVESKIGIIGRLVVVKLWLKWDSLFKVEEAARYQPSLKKSFSVMASLLFFRSLNSH